MTGFCKNDDLTGFTSTSHYTPKDGAGGRVRGFWQRNTHICLFEAAAHAAVIADDKKDMPTCCDRQQGLSYGAAPIALLYSTVSK